MLLRRIGFDFPIPFHLVVDELAVCVDHELVGDAACTSLVVDGELVAESTTRARLGEKVREKMMEESSGRLPLWEQEVPGSNPGAPTDVTNC